jgi:rhamnose transport system ATP-binding protein
MSAPLLRLIEIDKSFDGAHALKTVSLDLLPGEVHALVGENGAGKSTLVKVITGAVLPDAGEIEISGNPVSHLSPAMARQLGVVCIYQHPALFPDLTVAENIGLRVERPAPFGRFDWQKQRALANQLLSRIGAVISPGTLVGRLSMPHQQLVEIACAIGANARTVIMDEPTASLTQHEQHLLFEAVAKLRTQGVGIIYVSHRLDEVFALADRVTVLRDGQHVRTCRTSDFTEQGLIRLMVGRELSSAQQTSPTDLSASASTLENSDETQRETALSAALSLRNVSCVESGVWDISLELRAGEILGLAGLVGAGRTELAQTIFGLTPADAGEILVNGDPLVLDSPKTAVAHGIAYVPEDRTKHGIILGLPVEQNLTMAIHRKIFPGGWLRPGAERNYASEYIRALDIRPAAPEVRASSLSGGNQQKVAVARWLATKPRILILDEPTQGVDVGAKKQLHELIRRLAQNGLAVLLISSDLPELLALSDRIGVMREGRLVSLLPAKTDPHEVMAAAFGRPTT